MALLISFSLTRRPSFGRLLGRLLCAALVVFAPACSSIAITYYDATTYANLTALKAESMMLVETFDARPFHENASRIESLSLSLRKAHEYEKGKGDPNSDTARQFVKIQSLWLETAAEYQELGPAALGEAYFREAAVVLGQAFDLAIATENLKNQDKR